MLLTRGYIAPHSSESQELVLWQMGQITTLVITQLRNTAAEEFGGKDRKR